MQFTKFLLLDFGHPITPSATQLVKISLQHFLTLASALSTSMEIYTLRISILNSDFKLHQSSTQLHKNFNHLIKKLDHVDKKHNINEKITVREYKRFFDQSIQNIFCEFNLENKNGVMQNNSQMANVNLDVIVVTMKTASLLSEILMDVLKKYENSIRRFKIVQILKNQQETDTPVFQNSSSVVNWVTCLHSSFDLDCVFKDWLLKTESEQEHLKVTLSKDTDVYIKCDVEKCILKPPMLFRSELKWHADYPFGIINLQAPDNAQTNVNLEVLYRVPISGLRPTLIFGTKRRIHATHSKTLTVNESHKNRQIFAGLCQELTRTEEGLLTMFKYCCMGNEINFYYFLTPDGNTLLLNNIAPEELYLPKTPEFSKSVGFVDDGATSVIKKTLGEIQKLEKYSPVRFPSGLYHTLKNSFTQAAQKARKIDPMLKSYILKRKLTFKDSKSKINYGEDSSYAKSLSSTPTTSKELNTNLSANEQFGSKTIHSKKKRVISSDLDSATLHPALLSPNTAEKYRKIKPSFFYLPELNEAYLK